MPRHDTDQPERFLRRPQVEALCGLGHSRIYLMIRAGNFPKPLPLGPNSVAWRESEIRAWQAARIAERDRPGPMRRGRRPARRHVQAAE